MYRIGVINDFKGSYAFVDYKKFGEVESYQAFKTKSTNKPYNSKDDRIWVFLNYQKVAICMSKEDAKREIKKLIENAPTSFEGYLDYLLEDVSK